MYKVSSNNSTNPVIDGLDIEWIAKQIRANWGTKDLKIEPFGPPLVITYRYDTQGKQYAYVIWEYSSDEGIQCEMDVNSTVGLQVNLNGVLKGFRIYQL